MLSEIGDNDWSMDDIVDKSDTCSLVTEDVELFIGLDNFCKMIF